MEKLLEYFKNNRDAAARAIGCSVPFLCMTINGKRQFGHKKARHIEKITGGAVRKEHIRPDIFN
jgi:DNA-binding transcriptional regulator YdaS (Cro superfamily)